MKTILRLSTLILFASFVFGGCKKDETKLYYNGGTAPVLSATAASDTVSYLNADKIVLTLNWTNPDYTFTTGVSSFDVTYNIQVDTVGSNFTNPAKKTITVSKDLTYSFKATDLNDIMQNQLNLDTGMAHNLEFRVISYLTNNSAQLTSNSVQYASTPYVIPPKVPPSPSGELYITGSATDGGWMVGGGVGVPANQQFTKIDELHYTLTIHLNAGQEFLFIPVNGDWGNKYACKKEADQPKTGGDFGYNLSDNFPGPDASGTYKIDVDFQKGKYTVTKQ
jgi:hypothetical protein